MSLSLNIKKYRIEKGMTQETLAKALGVSAQAVSKWETSDTYPDGALLVPLANELDVSLDLLFGNSNAGSPKDISSRIRMLMLDTPAPKRFDAACEIGWMIEKGMFNCVSEIEDDEADKLKHHNLRSYVFNDHGFTYISSGDVPFFSVCSCPEEGYKSITTDTEQVRVVFEYLSDKDVMNGLITLAQKPSGFTFDSEFLAKECGIDGKRIDEVLKKLMTLSLLKSSRLEIDGELKTLYHNLQSFLVVALMLLAREVQYKGSYTLCTNTKSNKPMI